MLELIDDTTKPPIIRVIIIIVIGAIAYGVVWGLSPHTDTTVNDIPIIFTDSKVYCDLDLGLGMYSIGGTRFPLPQDKFDEICCTAAEQTNTTIK